MVIFVQKMMCSRKSGYIWQDGCFRTKVVVFGQKWLDSGKVVVFGKKWLYSDKVVVIGQL